MGMQGVHAGEVILHGFVIGGDFVLPDVSSHHQSFGTTGQPPRCRDQSIVVEAHAVEDALVRKQTKQTRLGIA